MSKIVEIPSIGVVEFPDSLSDEEIAASIQKTSAAPADKTATPNKHKGIQELLLPTAILGGSYAARKLGNAIGAPLPKFGAGKGAKIVKAGAKLFGKQLPGVHKVRDAKQFVDEVRGALEEIPTTETTPASAPQSTPAQTSTPFGPRGASRPELIRRAASFSPGSRARQIALESLGMTEEELAPQVARTVRAMRPSSGIGTGLAAFAPMVVQQLLEQDPEYQRMKAEDAAVEAAQNYYGPKVWNAAKSGKAQHELVVNFLLRHGVAPTP